MRIAMVSEHASPLATLGGVDAGGQNVHVAALSAALGRRGHEVTVFTRRDCPDLPDRVELAEGVLVEHVPAGPPVPVAKDELLPCMSDFARHLLERWSQERFDLAHSHFWMSGLASVLAAGEVGLPVVHTYHALGSVKRRHQGAKDTSPGQRVRIERSIARDAARIIATCSDEVFELLRLGLRRTAVSVVPCGVDTAHFRPEGPTLPRGRFPRRIAVVGRLVERKGVEDVIRALPAVPDTELVIAGGPDAAALDADPEVGRLRAVAAERAVADRVLFLGRQRREDVPALLRSADVVVCVPWYEPFGIVPLEAMACGVPVVASAVGGLVDTVVDGATGVLVPPRRPDALAQTLRGLLADPVRRESYGMAGVERARARFNWDRIAQDTEAVYAEVRAALPAGPSAAAPPPVRVDLSARLRTEVAR